MKQRIALQKLFCDKEIVRGMFLTTKDHEGSNVRRKSRAVTAREDEKARRRVRRSGIIYRDTRTGVGDNKKRWHRPRDKIPHWVGGKMWMDCRAERKKRVGEFDGEETMGKSSW